LNEHVRRARLKGAIAAEKIHRLLEVRERFTSTHERVDVFDALAWLDVRVVFKPLDGLLGAYIRGAQPGVMIGTKRPLSVQRFTAAHELGHAVLAHEPSLDSPNVLRRAASNQKFPKVTGFASYLQEIEADAFAGAFLLPNWLITHHARKHGWTRNDFGVAELVYQLSLRCGASYQATVWALERNRIIDVDARVRLLGVEPKEVKQQLGHVVGMADTRQDAWVLDEGDDRSDLPLSVGDTLTIELTQQASAGYVWLEKAEVPPTLIELDTTVFFDPERPGAPSTKRAFYRAEGPGAGSLPFEYKRPWENSGSRDLAFNFSVTEPEKGLSRANRLRMTHPRHQSDVG